MGFLSIFFGIIDSCESDSVTKLHNAPPDRELERKRRKGIRGLMQETPRPDRHNTKTRNY